MAASDIFDFCVFGGGLAGLAVAKKLEEKNASVCVIDIGEIASGASGAPLGMVNPATGRYGTKTWNAELCYEAISGDLETIQNECPVKVFDKTGILRPAQDKEMAARMYENVKSQDWPVGWCEWLNQDQFHEINPDIHCVDGGMWLPQGLTVNMEIYLKAKAEYLENRGVLIMTNARYTLKEKNGGYQVQLENGNTFQANALIFSIGFGTTKNALWNNLPLHPVKGQMAVFSSPAIKKFDYSISALGYIASISDTHFAAGSTYEHHFEDIEPDEDGLNYLKKRLGKVYPVLFKDAELVMQWAGVRLSTPNRKPFLGPHPDIENNFIFSGLGSKGLLYSVFLGDLLVEHILDGKEVPKEVSVSRMEGK